jgi:hypothetical protein
MRAFGIEYDLNVLTIQGNVKPPERKVLLFHDIIPFMEEVRRLSNLKIEWAPEHQVVTNLKVYSGAIPEIDLEGLSAIL